MNTLIIECIFTLWASCEKKTRVGNNILNMYTDIVKTYTYIADEVW